MKLQHLLMNTNPLECEMYGLQWTTCQQVGKV
jgi:hypothetical protein